MIHVFYLYCGAKCIACNISKFQQQKKAKQNQNQQNQKKVMHALRMLRPIQKKKHGIKSEKCKCETSVKSGAKCIRRKQL